MIGNPQELTSIQGIAPGELEPPISSLQIISRRGKFRRRHPNQFPSSIAPRYSRFLMKLDILPLGKRLLAIHLMVIILLRARNDRSKRVFETG